MGSGTAGPLGYLLYAIMMGGIYFCYFKRDKIVAKLASFLPQVKEPPTEAERIGGPMVTQMQEQLPKGDVNALVSAVTSSREGRWGWRAFLCEELATEIPGGLLEAWLMQNPNQPILQLLLGYRRIGQGWEARGHGDASSVSDDGAARQEALGREAVIAFRQAAALDPTDPTPYVGLLTAIKLAPPENIKGHSYALFGEVMRRDPENARALNLYLGILAPFWWGKEPEEALRAARTIAQGSPPGGMRPMGIFKAHQLEWHQRRHWGTPAEAEAYFRNPQVLAELHAAYAASIGSPAYQGDAYELFNLAAFCFYLAGDKANAQREFRRIGHRYDRYWNQLPGVKDDDAGYAKAKRWAGV